MKGAIRRSETKLSIILTMTNPRLPPAGADVKPTRDERTAPL